VDASTGTVRWSYTTGTTDTYVSTAGGVVFAATLGGTIDALKAKNGKLLWSYAAPGGNGAWNAPAVANGVVYYVGGGTIQALSASNGSLLWSDADAYNSLPTVANGLVFVTDRNNLVALDAATGANLWNGPGGFGNVNVSEAVPVNGELYVATLGGSIDAFSP